MFLSKISINRPIMMSMFLLVFVIFGGLAYFGLSLNLMPQVDAPYITVTTIYPGAGPREVEMQISKTIEDAIASISKLKNVTSYSMENVSLIVMEFELGKDVDVANNEVKDKISSIMNNFPTDAQDPVVEKLDITADPVIDFVISGKMDPVELYQIANDVIKEKFMQVDGAGKVTITGGQNREIQVKFENKVVTENILSLPQISGLLAAENLDMPAGNFQNSGQEISVRLKGEVEKLEELENIDIPTPFGLKKLKHLAEVFDSGEEIREKSIYFDNIDKTKDENIVVMSVIQRSGGNTVELAKGLKKAARELEAELPASVDIKIVLDRSTFIESTVEDTLNNIILGIIFTGLVLLFFLHDIRSTIIVAMAMPFAIISTFLLMQISGFTMNILTLMGLSTAVGILVTNSVVVLENIFRHKEMGHSRKNAADIGTAEITVAVLASTMTNIVVFLPIANMTSLVGQFFKEFALTVTYATIFSLIASFTITPMLASLILPEKDTKKHPIGKKMEAMFHAWERAYQRIVRGILGSRLRSVGVILVSVLLFIGSILLLAPKVGFEFMPAMDEGDIEVKVELPEGYNIDETTGKVQTIVHRVIENKLVKHALSSIGYIDEMDKGTNLAKIAVKLVDAKERNKSNNEVANELIKSLSDIPNATIRISAVSSGASSGLDPIFFRLKGNDLDKLQVYEGQIFAAISSIPGLVNLNTSSRAGKPEITLTPDRRAIADAGLNVQTIAFTLRAAMEGLVATQYKMDGNEYDVKIMMTDQSVDTPEKIENITIVSPRGIFRLGQLVKIEFSKGYSKILHSNKAKSVQFTGAVAPGYVLGDIKNEIDARLEELDFEPGYNVNWSGDAEMLEETTRDMARAFIIALVLTYMLLAATLEDLTQPLIILGTVPMALIGVFAGLYITGKTMNTVSMMAIIMLLGIVVNNAILLLDYTNQLVKKGLSVHDALIEACPTKLKPILMSTIAIIFGMLPMALGIGTSGAEIRQPMGIVSIGGLIVSTLLSLLIIPSLYYATSRSKAVQEITE
ncbi:MAG: efflux RND transporter permease subunit [Candidatus Marinimicrobia bacterium]|nr:efflux RND transporter permease subunit [Candidatus Neomarinimicrobiota bacterium]